MEEWKKRKDGMLKTNKKFVRKLSQHKGKRLDQFANEVHDKVFQRIDCLDCANCCSTIPPIVNTTDAKRIAKHLNMSVIAFENKYLTIDEDKDRVMNTTPCPFLQSDNKCEIYEVRPKACREYPHTDAFEFSHNLHLHATNATYCPAVFHILEAMKKSIPV